MLEPGKYYIGDLCYVLNDARMNELCRRMYPDDFATMARHYGEHTLADGTRLAVFGTAYGDGCYIDQNGKTYSVDAGIIGCMKLKDVDEAPSERLGNVYMFRKPFDTSAKDGVLTFGRIVIDTRN